MHQMHIANRTHARTNTKLTNHFCICKSITNLDIDRSALLWNAILATLPTIYSRNIGVRDDNHSALELTNATAPNKQAYQTVWQAQECPGIIFRA